MRWLATIAIMFAVLVAYSLLHVVYNKLMYRESHPNAEGWLTWRPGPASYLCGLLCTAILGLFLKFFVTLILDANSGNRTFFLIVSPLFVALMSYGVVLIFWVRVQASNQGVRYRGFRGWQFYPWDIIQGIDEFHGSLRLCVKGQRPKHFWPYGYGGREIVDLFRAHKKRVQLE